MGLELTEEVSSVRVAHGWIVVGDGEPLAVNPENITTLAARRVRSADGDGWAVSFYLRGSDGGFPRIVVVDFRELLAKLDKALKQRRR